MPAVKEISSTAHPFFTRRIPTTRQSRPNPFQPASGLAGYLLTVPGCESLTGMQSGEAFGVMGAPRASQPFEVGGQLTATMEWPTLTQHRHQRVNVRWAGKRHLRLP